MKTNKKDALVPFKSCPKCGGAGRIPCTGMELYQEKNRQWALLHHLRPVVIKWLKFVAPGIAVAKLRRGGWYCLRVYIGISNRPPFKGFIPWDVVAQYRVLDGEGAYDKLNGEKVWYVECAWTAREEVTILGEVPKKLGSVKLLLGESVEVI